MKQGLDVLDSIASVETDFGAGGEKSTPKERVEIIEMKVGIAAPTPDDAGSDDSPDSEGDRS